MKRAARPLILILLTLVTSFTLLLIVSPEPGKAFITFLTGPFSNLYTAGNTLAIAAILIISGCGISISFTAGLFNLGGEGQIYTSALAGTLTALSLPAGAGIPGMLLVIGVSMATGALIAGVSGVLKHRFHIHELISSFLLSGAQLSLVDYLISGPLRDTDSFLQTTRQIDASMHMTSILPPSNLTATIFIACLTAAALWLWLYHMPGGYELRVIGTNREFAAFGGISRGTYTIVPLLVNGACFGLAGALMVLSTQHASIIGFTSGYGWNGIVIALIAGNNPLLTIPSALLLAWMETGTRAAMAGSSMSFEISEVIRGIILLFITLKLVFPRRRTA